MKFNQMLHKVAATGHLEQVASNGVPYSVWSKSRMLLAGLFDRCYDPF